LFRVPAASYLLAADSALVTNGDDRKTSARSRQRDRSRQAGRPFSTIPEVCHSAAVD